MTDNIQDKLDEIQKHLDQSIKERKESKGFITKKGRLLDRAEWHATVLGLAPIGLGYILPFPLGELFIIAELAMLRTGFNKKMRGEKVEGHLGDVMDEIAYTFGATFVTTAVFHFFGIGDMTTIDMSQIVLALLGGA